MRQAKKKRMRFASGLPLQEAERQRCADLRSKDLALQIARRRVCRSGQHYDQKPSAETLARDQRIMGEADDA